LKSMVVVSICLSWSVLLGLLLWWHRELFLGWNTVGANVGGYPKARTNSPNTKERRGSNTFERNKDVRGDWESPTECLSFPP
jgi:hypothetical protein